MLVSDTFVRSGSAVCNIAWYYKTKYFNRKDKNVKMTASEKLIEKNK